MKNFRGANKMNNIKYIFLFLSILAISCNSPLDIDTDRYKKPTNPEQVRIKADLDEFDIEENGFSPNFKISEVSFVVDTINSIPCYWLKLSISKFPPVPPPPHRDSTNRMDIISFRIILDSVCFTGEPIRLGERRKFMECRVRRGMNFEDDTVLQPVGDNYGELFLNHNVRRKEIYATLHSKFRDRKMWIENVQRIVKDTIIKVCYDTIWVNNEMVIKERIDTIIKEKPVIVQEKKSARDSVSFHARFKFRY